MSNKKKIRLIGISGVILLLVLIALYIYSGNNIREYFIGIDYNELTEKIDNGESFVLVVSSTACSHCAQYKPKVKNFAKDNKVKIYYTDIDLYSEDDSETFSESFNVKGTPETLFFIDGQEESVMGRLSGDVSVDKLKSSLQKYGFID